MTPGPSCRLAGSVASALLAGRIAPGLRSMVKNSSTQTEWHHHKSLRPSCTWRELVAVEVITPAVGDGPPVAAA